MDMVNDGKDIRLDTPQAVKEALASGKDLYNPQTGEFWWEYNYTGSNPVTEEEALEFIEDCSKYPSYVIPGLDMPWEEYGPFGKVANDGRALEIINTLKRSSLATSLDDHPQGVSLKQAAMEAREASAKLFDKNVGADSPTRRDER